MVCPKCQHETFFINETSGFYYVNCSRTDCQNEFLKVPKENPDSQRTFPIGNEHKGKKFSEVPRDYLEWVVSKFEDGFVKTMSEKELKRRAGESLEADKKETEENQDDQIRF